MGQDPRARLDEAYQADFGCSFDEYVENMNAYAVKISEAVRALGIDDRYFNGLTPNLAIAALLLKVQR